MSGFYLGVSRRKFVRCGGVLATWVASVGWAKPEGDGPLAHEQARVGSLEMAPQGWLYSEKLDGVRALWDGQSLRFRSGIRIQAPAWFTRDWPRMRLDGELWLGRGSFEATVSTVKRQLPLDAAWRAVRYMVFDAPDLTGGFQQRIEALQGLIPTVHGGPLGSLEVVEQRSLANAGEARAWMQTVLALGGEGLVAHRADAPFQAGRHDGLLKFKPRLDDEAVVLGTQPGQGRLRGLVGALRVRNRSGVEFELGSGLSDQLRVQPPCPGTLVTYTYQSLTEQGVPRFASFLRLHPGV